MKIDKVMTTDVKCCRSDETLNAAAKLMWEHDVGCVPVVDEAQRVVGMLTDRDVCMAAYTKGTTLSSVPVAAAMSDKVISCDIDESLATVEQRMRIHKIRRLPVLKGTQLVGMVSLNDIARAWQRRVSDKKSAISADDVATTLASICEPRLLASSGLSAVAAE
jgi:CBS domain-containing protein